MHIIKVKKQVKIILITFYLTKCIPNIIFPVCNQYQNIIIEIFCIHFGAKSLKTAEYFTLKTYLKLDCSTFQMLGWPHVTMATYWIAQLWTP